MSFIDLQNLVYEHDDFLVVAKPPGIPVHNDGFRSASPPLLQQVRDMLGHRVWPIHRIDRQCSGCVLFSKQQVHVHILQQSLQEGTKRYVALVRGIIKQKNIIEVTNPIKVDKVRNKYKDARTLVWCLKTQSKPPCSMVIAEPKTGRQHQIRRHLRDINHPIIHDGDHGDSRINRFWREQHNMKRLGLHALSIDFEYQNQEHKMVSPLFEDHYNVFQNLDFWQESQQQIKIFQHSPIKIKKKL